MSLSIQTDWHPSILCSGRPWQRFTEGPDQSRYNTSVYWLGWTYSRFPSTRRERPSFKWRRVPRYIDPRSVHQDRQHEETLRNKAKWTLWNVLCPMALPLPTCQVQREESHLGPLCEKTMIAGTLELAPKFLMLPNDAIVRLRDGRPKVVRLLDNHQVLTVKTKILLFGRWNRLEDALQDPTQGTIEQCDAVRMLLFPSSTHTSEWGKVFLYFNPFWCWCLP